MASCTVGSQEGEEVRAPARSLRRSIETCLDVNRQLPFGTYATEE